jgi:predicted nucleic acid-binding protein
MDKFVLDSSVLLAHSFQESEQATKRIEDIFNAIEKGQATVYCNQLLLLEYANIVKRRMPAKEGIARFARFLRLPLEDVSLPTHQYLNFLKLAYETGDTVYDASHHVFALAYDATYVTADKRYADKVKGTRYEASLEYLPL